MKKFVVIAIFAILSVDTFSQTIGEVIKSMPNDIIFGLSDENREILTTDTAQISLVYNFGKIEKLKQTDDYIKIKTSQIGNMQIKLLQLVNNTKIICLIRTVCSKDCDSHIDFFDKNWARIDAKYILPKISLDMFATEDAKKTGIIKNDLSLPGVVFISADFVDGSSNITLTLNYKNSVDNEHIAKFEDMISSNKVVLEWNNSTFK